MNINEIVKKAIIIAPYSYHKSLIETRNQTTNLVDIKIMTIDEFLNNFFFSYDEKTIVYLMNKYNLKYSLATFYLKQICTLENKVIPYLKEMMDDLKQNNLLKENIFFKSDLKNREIYVYGYSHFSKYYQNILKQYHPTYIKLTKLNYEHPIYKYHTLNDEINNVAIKIITLHKKNIPFSKIKIINGENFINIIKRIFKNYHIPITETKTSIYSSIIVKTFLDNLTDPISDTLSLLQTKFNLKKEENNKIYNQIIDLLNKYSFVTSYKSIKDCLKEEFKKITYQIPPLKESVEFTNLEIPIVNDNYYFIIGMNQNIFPILKKDDDFLSDDIKEKIGLETAKEYNINELTFLNDQIKTIPNLWLSFHESDGKSNFIPSLICKKLNFEITENNLFSKTRFSKLEDKLNLARAFDEWIKYGTINPNLNYLNNHLTIPYHTYNNQFNGIKKEVLLKHLKSITLSYTSLNNYYKCPFKFYCSFILKLEQYKTTFEAFVGSVFHNVLSKAFDKNNTLDTNTLYNQAIKEETDKLKDKKCQLELTEENKSFLTFLQDDINFIVDTIKEQLKNTKLTNALFEKKITVLKNKEIPVTFKGFIDKILFLEDKDKTYITIIDYKTGKEEIELKNIKFGLNLQLPVYLYLASKLKEWNNPEIIGFYLQKILNKEQSKSNKYTYEQQKKEALKLEGYTTTNIDILEKLDPNYLNSQLIKGLRIKNDGTFYSTVKSLSSKKMQEIINYVDKLIDEASDNIINGKFEIKPKRIDNKNKSCNFCPFKEICYLEEKDVENLKSPENLDFLGGE